MAAAAMASSLLVVLPMAETTTTGWRSRRSLTMPETRAIAASDSTDVPPNFMTIMRAFLPSGKNGFHHRGTATQRNTYEKRLTARWMASRLPWVLRAQRGQRTQSAPRGSGWNGCRSWQQHSFRMHELGVEYGRAG